jgi:nitrite reductase/ring-hydroxylating ferredoxin subunit/uncharacterized membrane protein
MMLLRTIIEAINRQEWPDKASKTTQKLVRSFYESGGSGMLRVRDFLHGVWLGHPLHPVLTDVPVGAWAAALILDRMEVKTRRLGYAKSADTAIVVGLVGAAGAAVTGVTDWHHTEGRPRRVGTMHAILNTTAAILYIGSLAARRSGNRQTGRSLALGGFAIVSAAAYLGGHLVYDLKIGVDRSPDITAPEDFTPVLPESELVENNMKRVVVNDIPVLLVRQNGRVFALAETCAHMGGPLAEGRLHVSKEGRPASVECPWHGSLFALTDGKPIEGPSTYFQPCLEARIRDGQIEVRAVNESIN